MAYQGPSKGSVGVGGTADKYGQQAAQFPEGLDHVQQASPWGLSGEAV